VRARARARACVLAFKVRECSIKTSGADFKH